MVSRNSMSNVLLIAGAIGGFLILIFCFWFFSTWNRLINLEENIENSWAQISVMLKQRYDMIPNLVNIAKGMANQEIKFFDKLFEARALAAGALQQGDVAGVARAESAFAAMIPRINMVAEQYPDLKADSSFVNLQNQLVTLENQVSDRREFYNASTTNWNSAIQMIPTNIVAGMMSAQRRDLFEVTDPVQREAVQISF